MEISVLAIDIKGFNEAAAALAPIEVAGRLNRFYKSVIDAVIARDGTVDKMIGERVVAFFGAPFNAEEHEQRALDAAAEVMRTFGGFWNEAPQLSGALGSGVAFVGRVGYGDTSDFTAVGALVNRVLRAREHANPGELLMLPEAYAAIAGRLPDLPVRTLPHDPTDESIGVRILQFRREAAARGKPVTRRELRTILVLDLVGSTEVAAKIGDAAWRDLLARHYEDLRALLVRHGGAEIDTAGDGLLATFAAPAEAIRFAREVEAADRAMGLAARIGIHTGEVELDDGTLRGIAVVIAARIAGLADADEIFVSSTVRELVTGSGISFADRGVRTLKGVPEARQVYQALPTES